MQQTTQDLIEFQSEPGSKIQDSPGVLGQNLGSGLKRIEGLNFNPGPDPRSKIQDSAQRVMGESWILARIEIQSLNPVSIQVTVPPSFMDLVYVSVCVCVWVWVWVWVCVCVWLLNVGVFTREDRPTDDMKNKQAGIAHEELKTDRKAWIFGGGTIYIYMYIHTHVCRYLYVYVQMYTYVRK